jgi:hypothetical protein
MKTGIDLKLFIHSSAPDSQQALEVINALQKSAGKSCHIDIIDVLANPKEALKAGILVTPTLIWSTREKTRRIIGRLQDVQQVASTLGLDIVID